MEGVEEESAGIGSGWGGPERGIKSRAMPLTFLFFFFFLTSLSLELKAVQKGIFNKT